MIQEYIRLKSCKYGIKQQAYGAGTVTGFIYIFAKNQGNLSISFLSIPIPEKKIALWNHIFQNLPT